MRWGSCTGIATRTSAPYEVGGTYGEIMPTLLRQRLRRGTYVRRDPAADQPACGGAAQAGPPELFFFAELSMLEVLHVSLLPWNALVGARTRRPPSSTLRQR